MSLKILPADFCRFIVVFLLLTFLSAPSGAQELPLQNGFAAKVNGEVITLAELTQLIDRQLEPNIGRVPDSIIELEREKMKPVALKELIERRLMVQQAGREGIVLPEDAVDDHLKRTVDRLSRVEGTRFSIDDYLFLWRQQFGESEDQLRKKIGEEILITELRDRKLKISTSISPRELRTYYRDNVDEFTQDGSVSFRQLLVPINDQDSPKIIKQVDEGIASGESLTDLITKYSNGPRAADGGLYEMKDSQLDDRFPPVPEVVRGLSVGQISDWFVCRGYSHKILLEEKIPGGPLNFSEAQGQIRLILREKLIEKKRKKFERDLWKKAKIEVFLPGVKISGTI
ncbi:MAG: hypothetical protein CBC13_05045 [Planctomycetia bacterium TMED53]|nr:MAG: hypothetical protein CBC13_05045 [Planctomycetia bacterium TMED53]